MSYIGTRLCKRGLLILPSSSPEMKPQGLLGLRWELGARPVVLRVAWFRHLGKYLWANGLGRRNLGQGTGQSENKRTIICIKGVWRTILGPTKDGYFILGCVCGCDSGGGPHESEAAEHPQTYLFCPACWCLLDDAQFSIWGQQIQNGDAMVGR